jgi:hypothetical protein
MKLHLKRCVMCLLIGLALGGYGSHKLQAMIDSNVLVKFLLTGKVL